MCKVPTVCKRRQVGAGGEPGAGGGGAHTTLRSRLAHTRVELRGVMSGLSSAVLRLHACGPGAPRRRLTQLLSLRAFRPGRAAAAVGQDAADEQHVFEVPAPGAARLRLDAFLAEALPAASRARLQASIRGGLVSINGVAAAKASAPVRPGDVVAARVLPLPPLGAAPEDLPLAVVFEDAHVLVVDKAAGMVVHPSAGHARGTLVNALLHHCGLPGVAPPRRGAPPPLSLDAVARLGGGGGGGAEGLAGADAAGWTDVEDEEDEDEDDDDLFGAPGSAPRPARGGGAPLPVRPGIVHRLDRGTTGLLVVAKSDAAHASLAAQFAARAVERAYDAITLGAPREGSGRVETAVGRDPRHRQRMAALPLGARGARAAASRFAVVEALAAGGAALTEWRLETGRTHQVRVHAKHLGCPLLGDDAYGGGGAAAERRLAAAGRPAGAGGGARAAAARAALAALGGRPALHARLLGFAHPVSGERLRFEAAPPPDFAEALRVLREELR